MHNSIPKYYSTCLAGIGILMISLLLKDPKKTNDMTDVIQEINAVDDKLSSLKRANAWINTTSLTSAELKGKVVLVEFGTYTCINWLRTLPYVKAWYEKYKDKGFEVIIVHTPEFTFEKNIEQVRRSIKELDIAFPIAIDNKYEIWNTFNNRYWPAFYFIDIKGKIRHQQFGEGEYDRSEQMIQELLREAGANEIDKSLVMVSGDGVEAAPDLANLNSPENYLGYERTANFASPDNVFAGRNQTYKVPRRLRLNEWALSGEWSINEQFVRLNKPNGRILTRFHARDLHLVMGPAVPGTKIRFRILIDGKPPLSAHGVDIDEQGNGIIDQQRMYQLIRQPLPIKEREFIIEFLDSDVEAFAFTFG